MNNKLDDLLNFGVKDGVYPGAAISIGNRDGELYRAVYGSRQLLPEVLPLEEDTLFDLASLTKIVSTTMVALKLIDGGKLHLDDRIGKFFDCPLDKKSLTIFDLMTHAGGLPAHVRLDHVAKSPNEVYDYILGLDLLAPAGKEVAYSCLGYILLGKICEQVGGKTLDKLAHEWVFAPLGLENTLYNPTIKKPYTYAVTEKDADGNWLSGVVHDENARYMGGVSGNAGIFSNIEEAGKLARMFANKAVGILSEDLFDHAVQNHTPNCGEARGLGFAVKGDFLVSCGKHFARGSYGHTGYTGTSMWIDPTNGLYIVFLTNRVHPTRENNKHLAFRREVHDLAYEIFV